MISAFLTCGSILFISFSLQAKLEDKRHQHQLENATEYSNQERKNSPNQTNESDELMCWKKRSALKNYVDEIETHYATGFDSDKIERTWDYKHPLTPPHQKEIMIRSMTWDHIFWQARETFFVRCLRSEMKKANVSESKFCDDIAQTYSVLDNASSCDLLQKDSIVVFMKVIHDLKLDVSDSEEIVRIPKSAYIELIRKDAQVELEIHRHVEASEYWKDRISRFKEVYRERVRRARCNRYHPYGGGGKEVNSDVDY